MVLNPGKSMADTIRDHLVAALKDTHALEQMSLQMTETGALAADDAELRMLFEEHHRETEGHERLIRERLDAFGARTSTIRDVTGRVVALAKGVEVAVPADTPGRLARDGYVQEHTEIASYELLRRIAELAGDHETADVARRILTDERQAADRFAHCWDRAAQLTLELTGVA
jgi:ferritin-like metal-binding protein YciE